jgi:hypothetical protein
VAFVSRHKTAIVVLVVIPAVLLLSWLAVVLIEPNNQATAARGSTFRPMVGRNARR